MKYTLYICIALVLCVILSPQKMHAASCSGSGYSYTVTGHTFSNGVYTWNGWSYGGKLYNVSMTFTGTSDDNVSGQCLAEYKIQQYRNIASQKINSFLAKNQSTWQDTSAMSCGNTHIYSRTLIQGTNATCGGNARVYSADETAYPGTSPTNYCATGNNITFDANNNYIATPAFPAVGSSTSWICGGLDGGSNISCTASRNQAPVAGDCGDTAYQCDAGSSITTSTDESPNHEWTCTGVNAGASVQCSIPKNPTQEPENNGDSNNVSGNFTPVCVYTPDNVSIAGSEPLVLIVQGLLSNPSLYEYDWSDYNGLYDTESQGVSINSAASTTIPDDAISVQVTGGGVSKTAYCPAGYFVDGVNLTIDQPIVEPTAQCELAWDNIPTGFICTLYDEQGTVIESNLTVPTGTRLVSPTNKYRVECDAPADLENPSQTRGSIESVYRSCIKKGQLQEI